jgi:hypothetical protein
LVPPGQPAASRSPWAYSGNRHRRASGPGLILRGPTDRRRQPLPRPGPPAPGAEILPRGVPSIGGSGSDRCHQLVRVSQPIHPGRRRVNSRLEWAKAVPSESRRVQLTDVSRVLGLWSLVPLGGLPGSSPYQVSSLLQLRGPYVQRGSLACAESRPSGLRAGSSPAQVSSHRRLCRFACPVPRAPIRVRLPVANVWKAAGAAHVQPYGVVCALVRQRRH